MLQKLKPIAVAAIILTIQYACKNESHAKAPDKNAFFEQIKQLKEFKDEEKRVDSIKKNSDIPVDLTAEIIDSSFLDEDKGKHILLGFITEKYLYGEDRIIYTIKFDKDKQKIISVKKDENQFNKQDAGSPTDIVFPVNKQ